MLIPKASRLEAVPITYHIRKTSINLLDISPSFWKSMLFHHASMSIATNLPMQRNAGGKMRTRSTKTWYNFRCNLGDFAWKINRHTEKQRELTDEWNSCSMKQKTR